MSTAILGIDFGTSGLKTALWRADGAVLAEAEVPYGVDHPRDGWSETDPVAWTAALAIALDGLAARAGSQVVVASVGITGQMHGAVLVDADGRPVRPAVLWTDCRADLALWRALPEALRAPLANPLVAGMTGPIVHWIGEHEPESLTAAATVLLPKDAVRSWLVTDPALPAATTDRSDAAGTLLWDVPRDDWAVATAAALGIPARLLPGVAPSDAVAGTTERLARWFPASGTQVPVVVGAGDTPAARLAVGSPELQLNLGTGAQVLGAQDRVGPGVDPLVHTYADTGSGDAAGWYSMVAIQNAGLAIDWARRVLGFGWEEAFSAAAGVPDGARGATFLPFLTGERGGVAGPQAGGSWTGLTEATGPAELMRAAVEGVVFAVGEGVRLLPTTSSRLLARGGFESADGPEPDAADLVATGGGARNPLVRRLLADALGRTVRCVEVRSATALGAAILAARGVGMAFEVRPERGAVQSPVLAPALEEAAARWRRAVRAVPGVL